MLNLYKGSLKSTLAWLLNSLLLMVDSWGSNSHFLLIETADGERTIRQDLWDFVPRALHLSHPLALPCSSDCITGLLNPPHSLQSGEPPSPRMNLRHSSVPLLLLTGLLNFCEEPRRMSIIVSVDQLILICIFCIFSQGNSAEDVHVRTSFSVSLFSAADRHSLVLQFLLDAFYEESYFYFVQLFSAESGHCAMLSCPLWRCQIFRDSPMLYLAGPGDSL